MGNHQSPEENKHELESLLSKLNAMEIIAHDEFQKGTVKILRRLVEGQIHTVNEFEHIKKALDLITLELFQVKNKNSL
ncbi:MAG: hypothetical protein ACKO7N_06030 [Candidatus Nitrosotenuis sp.]